MKTLNIWDQRSFNLLFKFYSKEEYGEIIHIISICKEIKYIPKDITKLTNLEMLDLDRNNIKEISTNLTRLPNLQLVFLEDNSIPYGNLIKKNWINKYLDILSPKGLFLL